MIKIIVEASPLSELSTCIGECITTMDSNKDLNKVVLRLLQPDGQAPIEVILDRASADRQDVGGYFLKCVQDAIRQREEEKAS